MVFIVVLVLLGIWWLWPAEMEPPAPAPPPPQVVAPPPPPEPEPEPIVMIDAGPEPVVEVAPIVVPPDAGVRIAAKDAGTSVTQTKALSTTFQLKEGNKVGVAPKGQSPFLEICQREAEACAVNELFWDLPPSMALVDLEPTGDGVVVKGLGRIKIGGNDRFWSCLERALKAAPMTGVEPAKKWSCRFESLKTAVNDTGEVVKKVSECLGPVTPASSIELSWDLVNTGRQVEVQHLKVSPNVPLDGYAQRCIEQAATAAPRRFTQETKPPFSQRHLVVTVLTWNEGGPRPSQGIPVPPPRP